MFNTPAGVQSVLFDLADTGGVLVTERIKKTCCQHLGFKEEECKLLLVIDTQDRSLLWNSAQDGYELRKIVGKWFRIKSEFAESGNVGAMFKLSADVKRLLFQQLSADAEHSDLLVRLFKGEEPMPIEEWRWKNSVGYREQEIKKALELYEKAKKEDKWPENAEQNIKDATESVEKARESIPKDEESNK